MSGTEGAGVLGRQGVPSIGPPMRIGVRGAPSNGSSECTGVCGWGGGGSSGSSGGSWYTTSNGGGGARPLAPWGLPTHTPSTGVTGIVPHPLGCLPFHYLGSLCGRGRGATEPQSRFSPRCLEPMATGPRAGLGPTWFASRGAATFVPSLTRLPPHRRSQGRSGTVILVYGLAEPPGLRELHLCYWFVPRPQGGVPPRVKKTPYPPTRPAAGCSSEDPSG